MIGKDKKQPDIKFQEKQILELEDQVKKLIASELNQYDLQAKLDIQKKDLAGLVKLSQGLSAEPDESEIAGVVAEAIVESFDYERSILYTRDPNDGNITPAGFDGYYEETASKAVIEELQTDLLEIIGNHHIKIEPSMGKPVSGMDHRVIISCRSTHGKIIGIIILGNTRERSAFHREIDSADRLLWETIGNMTASAFENARLYAQLKTDRKSLKKTRDDLKILNEDLEKKVEERTGELEKSKNEYRELYFKSRQTSDLYRALLDASPDAIVVYDQDGYTTYINPAFEQIFGWNMNELQGKRIDFVPPESQGETDKMIAKVLRGEQLSSQEIRRYTKDRRILDISLSASTFSDQSGRVAGSIVFLRDITKTKQMEEEILKVRKLESVGLLAGGIAHDFNNALSGILMSAQLAQVKMSQKKDVRKNLSDIKEAAENAASLTNQLLTFARGGKPIMKTLAIDKVIQDWAGFALRGSNVKCEFNLAKHLASVKADEGQISQAINNLILNAIQAMPGGGTININARNVSSGSKERDMDRLSLEKGNYVKVSIEDKGGGIPEDIIQKIFDPYFTTKKDGAGLGLATTFSIIRKHNGYLTVESNADIGTVFHMYLPASGGEPAQEDDIKSSENLVKGKGKVLLMEDGEILKDILVEMVETIGYEPDLVVDGEQAIEKYNQARENGRPYDAVILDLTIPGGLGGKETMEKLLEMDPSVKAIVSSGYSTDPIMADFEMYGFKGVLPKPYDYDKLTKLLSRLIPGKE